MITKESLYPKFEQLISGYNKGDKELIHKAYHFAILHHNGQNRVSGEEFVIHPISVAIILAEMNTDKDMIISGLLHDVVEDTDVTIEEVKTNFGEGVANLVDGVTKISKLKSKNKRERNAETIRKMLFAMTKDMRVIIVKLADKIHNMRTLNFMPKEKIRRIAKETIEIYAPLAGKLGMNVIKNELENLSLRWLNPETYEIIDNFMQTHKEDKVQITSLINKKIAEKLEKMNIPFSIKARTKHYYSVYKKMKNFGKRIDEIFDLYGVRVITNSIENCYHIFGIVHSLWQPLPNRFKDYIANPKANGYKSLHTTVLVDKRKAVEIQIRTEEMDEFNEYGIASHWYYKKGTAPKTEELNWLKKLMDVNNEKMSTDEYYQTIRDEILKDEMYVFTPKGDVVELPQNSTPLDFAYRIHTEVGHRCKGARANGSIIPLNYQLKNGMVVEIITGKEPNPKEAWLSIVRTSNAKKKIRHFFVLKQQEEDNQKNIEPQTKDKSLEQKEMKTEEKKQLEKTPPKNYSQDSKITIEVDGEKNLLFSFAKCCNPTPLDKIVGFVSRGRGIIIHRDDCRNLTCMKDYKERLIEVNWLYKAKNKICSFIFKTFPDSTAFGDIGSIIQKYEGHILEKTLDSSNATQNKIEGYFTAELPNSVNINLLLKQLKKIPSILFIDKKNMD
ncbi:MAG TPA: bifunctional (p)ppGpp synthetase/guanosine-3',5'-bis(diphosphate) 3'-pyrophosphohydrolase [Spirochaetota bacterium]|nr:bifunctional (p)ppGpp synthetase/guanosine-3',5'-bis(diphosphate) 3'-pyrophosphohydrolase [Spirochaetota bacterium]